MRTQAHVRTRRHAHLLKHVYTPHAYIREHTNNYLRTFVILNKYSYTHI